MQQESDGGGEWDSPMASSPPDRWELGNVSRPVILEVRQVPVAHQSLKTPETMIKPIGQLWGIIMTELRSGHLNVVLLEVEMPEDLLPPTEARNPGPDQATSWCACWNNHPRWHQCCCLQKGGGNKGKP